MNTLGSVRTPPHNKTMGIEIECFISTNHDDVMGNFHGFFYAGRDGSLSSDNYVQMGVEFVSQPLTKDWMIKEIKKLYKKFPDTTVNRSCGIHIHVSKKWLSEKKAKAIQKFINEIGTANFEEFFGRQPNSYCQNNSAYNDTRYSAVNLTNRATIEFRMFKSGDVRWALYTLACVEYMMQNAYHLNVDAFYAFVAMAKPQEPGSQEPIPAVRRVRRVVD